MDFNAFAKNYADWLAANKIDIHAASGLNVRREGLHGRLFEYQKDAVLWALRRGHGLLAERFGMGKTNAWAQAVGAPHGDWWATRQGCRLTLDWWEGE